MVCRCDKAGYFECKDHFLCNNCQGDIMTNCTECNKEINTSCEGCHCYQNKCPNCVLGPLCLVCIVKKRTVKAPCERMANMITDHTKKEWVENTRVEFKYRGNHITTLANNMYGYTCLRCLHSIKSIRLPYFRSQHIYLYQLCAKCLIDVMLEFTGVSPCWDLWRKKDYYIYWLPDEVIKDITDLMFDLEIVENCNCTDSSSSHSDISGSYGSYWDITDTMGTEDIFSHSDISDTE